MSQYINVQTLFKGGNYSRAETICKGRNFHWAERQKKTKWSRLQWCPPCQNKTRISGGDKCIFNGTLFHISDIRVRIKRSIDLQNETSLILRKVDQRNQTMVSMHFLFADAKLQYLFSLLLLKKISPIFFHDCVLITVYLCSSHINYQLFLILTNQKFHNRIYFHFPFIRPKLLY